MHAYMFDKCAREQGDGNFARVCPKCCEQDVNEITPSKMSIIHFKASIHAFDVKRSITTRIGATCSDRQHVKCNQKTTSVELRTILKGYVLLPLTLKDRRDRIEPDST